MLGDQQIDFTGTVPSASALPQLFYTGQAPIYSNNSIYDHNGDLLFFVVNGASCAQPTLSRGAVDIYDNTGEIICCFEFDVTFVLTRPNNPSEFVILPVPGDCKGKYYIIAGLQYIIIDTETNPYTVSSTIRLDLEPPFSPHCEHTAYAVSPLTESGIRYLYISGCQEVNKYIVSSSGISHDKFWNNPFSSDVYVARSEMELVKIADGTTDQFYKLALTANGKLPPFGFPGNVHITVHTLNESGDQSTVLPNAVNILDLGPSPDQRVKGLEFSPNGRYLYFTTSEPIFDPSNDPHYIHVYDLELSGGIPLFLTNEIDFKDSHIELAYDGKLYFAASDRLASLADPNNPTTVIWDPNALTGLNIPLSHGIEDGNPNFKGVRVLPDQIDGEDLDLVRASHQSLAYTATVSATWTPTNNPFGDNTMVVFNNHLTIPEGVTITVKDMVLKFKDGVGIVIERSNNAGFDGGELVLDNTILSSFDNCDTETSMWKGINIHGNNLASQFPGPDRVQGKLVVRNNSVIENAMAAANTFNPATGDAASYTGGIIQAINSTFRNNVQAVQMVAYENFLPVNGQAYKDLSYFKNCVFETTQQLNDPSLYPLRFVGLFDVNGINFFGNTFQNTIPMTFNQATVSNRGTGIESISAGFSVKDLCQDNQPAPFPCQNLKSNTFSGLHYGIQSFAFGGFDNIIVDHAEFLDNKSGIRLNGVNYATITSNTVTVAPYDAPYPWDPSELPYGLYLNGCTGYKVENNLFNTSDAGTQIVLGTVVFNSGDLPNEIYRNQYENLYVNILAEGDNRGPNSEDGLQLKCNEFFNLRDLGISEGWDIAVTKLGFGSTAEGIAEFQGACDNTDLSSPAGNRFYFSMCQLGDDANLNLSSNFLLSGDTKYSHQSDFATTPQTDCYTPFTDNPSPTPDKGVQLNSCSFAFNEPQSCPTSFRTKFDLEMVELNPGCIFVNGIWICEDILDYYASAVTGLVAKIDGGDTQFLLSKISQGTSPGALKKTLLAASPLLSDQVLIATIHAGLPPGILKEILIANSKLSGPVLVALDGIFLPKGIANQINAAQAGISPMTVLKSRIAYNLAQRALGVNELIRNYMDNDNLNESRAKILTLLKEESFKDAKESREHEHAAANIEQNELTDAEAVLNSIHQGTPDNICKLLQMEIDLKRANKSIKELNQSQEVLVRSVAANLEHRESAKAQSMLKAGYNETSEEVIILPTQIQLKVVPEENTTALLAFADKLKIFPNPFSNFTTIEANIPDESMVGNLKIVDLMGVTYKIISIDPGYNAITILSEELPSSGIYFCILEADMQVIGKTKFVVVK